MSLAWYYLDIALKRKYISLSLSLVSHRDELPACDQRQGLPGRRGRGEGFVLLWEDLLRAGAGEEEEGAGGQSGHHKTGAGQV